MQSVTKKWQEKYPNAMRRWEENWDVLSPMFKFSAEVRKVMYTTNAIESLNSVLRRLNSQRSVFPSNTALLKALYLATFEATKKWTMPLRNWGRVYGELSIMYDGRLVQHIFLHLYSVKNTVFCKTALDAEENPCYITKRQIS